MPGGLVVLVDNLDITGLCSRIRGGHLDLTKSLTFTPEILWDRVVAERATTVFAQGWVAQMRLESPRDREREFRSVWERMRRDMERQLAESGRYNPLQPLRLLVFRRSTSHAEDPPSRSDAV
jgi:hypothetical protein